MTRSHPARSRWVLVVGCLLATILGPGFAAHGQNRQGFEDVGDSVHSPAISALEKAGILEGTGCGGDRFCPNERLERWVMAVWITRAVESGDPNPMAVAPFTDVDSGVWWAPHVERLNHLGITRGCATGPARYCPQEPVTRAQMATFLARAFRLDPSGWVGFADTASNTHEPSINALAMANITTGCDTSPVRYCPDSTVTRAQMATFLARALDLVTGPGGLTMKFLDASLREAVVGGAKHVVYGRGAQHVWLIGADGTLFDSYPVSGRADWPVPGRYKVLSKSRHTRSFQGGITMEYMVRFVQPPGKAATGFHDIPLYSDGTPMQTTEELGQYRSAGCVRQRDDKAQQLYEWAPIGTPVVVLG